MAQVTLIFIFWTLFIHTHISISKLQPQFINLSILLMQRRYISSLNNEMVQRDCTRSVTVPAFLFITHLFIAELLFARKVSIYVHNLGWLICFLPIPSFSTHRSRVLPHFLTYFLTCLPFSSPCLTLTTSKKAVLGRLHSSTCTYLLSKLISPSQCYTRSFVHYLLTTYPKECSQYWFCFVLYVFLRMAVFTSMFTYSCVSSFPFPFNFPNLSFFYSNYFYSFSFVVS